MSPRVYPLGTPGSSDRKMASVATPTAVSKGYIDASALLPYSPITDFDRVEDLSNIKNFDAPAIKIRIEPSGRIGVSDGNVVKALAMQKREAYVEVEWLGNADEVMEDLFPLRSTSLVPATTVQQALTAPTHPEVVTTVETPKAETEVPKVTEKPEKPKKELTAEEKQKAEEKATKAAARAEKKRLSKLPPTPPLTLSTTKPTSITPPPSVIQATSTSVPSIPGVSDRSSAWLAKWKENQSIEPPSESIQAELSKYRPTAPVTAFRGIKVGQEEDENKKRIKSYTYNKEDAIKDAGPDGQVAERLIQPLDIIVDYSFIPNSTSKEIILLEKMVSVNRKVIHESRKETQVLVNRSKVMMDITASSPDLDLETIENKLSDYEIFRITDISISDIEEGDIPSSGIGSVAGAFMDNIIGVADETPITLDNKFGLIEGGDRVRRALDRGETTIKAYVPSTMSERDAEIIAKRQAGLE